jgi:hypothetical protein
MSGPLTVPFAAAALYLPGNTSRLLFGGLALLCGVVSCYRVWAVQYAVATQTQQCFDKKFGSLPRLKVEDGGFLESTRYSHVLVHADSSNSNSTVTTDPAAFEQRQLPFSCLALRVMNEPISPTPDSEARNVGIRLRFFDHQGNRLFSLNNGRWSDTAQPPHLQPNQTPIELTAVDICNGRERVVDLVLRYPTDEHCFAVNNDSYGYNLLRNPAWQMASGEYGVEVTLEGINVRQRWLLKFRNPEGTGPLIPLSCHETA